MGKRSKSSKFSETIKNKFKSNQKGSKSGASTNPDRKIS